MTQKTDLDRARFDECGLIAPLSQSDKVAAWNAAAIEEFVRGADLIEQGGEGYPFSVLVEGRVEVLQRDHTGQERVLAQLDAGAYFGEQALVGNASGTASATVRALENCRLVTLDKESFLTYIAANPSARAVLDRTLLLRCPPIAELSEDAKQKVLENLMHDSYAVGQDIIVQDSVGKSFFILVEGTVDVLRKEESGNEVLLVSLGPGSYFGEQALLGQALGRRSATVRAQTECRALEIPATIFDQVIVTSGNKELFEKDASRYVYEQVSKSLDAYVATELDENVDGVERVQFRAGQRIVTEGEDSDCAYMLLDGIALVVQEQQNDFHELARLGAGQILGELGVLEGKPRSATVIAESKVEALKIDAAPFKKWFEAHPIAADFFRSLSQVYSLSQGRKLSLFMGDVGGEQTLTTVVGNPGEGVVSTRVLNQGVVVFSNAAAGGIEGERDTLTFEKDQFKRELRVLVKERKGEQISRCVVYGVSAEGVENDLGTLYQHVLNLDEVDSAALRRFERTGFLGADADRKERLCPCLGMGPNEVRAAVAEVGSGFDDLQANFGLGSICGGCERAVRSFVEQDHPQSDALKAEDSDAVPNSDEPGTRDQETGSGHESESQPQFADVPFEQLSTEEQQLARLLGYGMGHDEVAVSKQQIAVRLRATGVRDMDFYIEMLFPGAFKEHDRASYTALAAAVGRGMGFGPWRAEALEGVGLGKELILVLARFVRTLKLTGFLGFVALVVASSIGFLPLEHRAVALKFWGFVGIGLTILLGYLYSTDTGRFVLTLVFQGPEKFYRALYSVFGAEESIAKLNLPGGTTWVARDEKIVDYLLQNPHKYGRFPITHYPPFGAHSQLGGGSGGVWLGYRMLLEEYFAERYRDDLDELRTVVQERIAMWADRKQINLLEEIYRIVVEIRARLFFQTSFDSFDDSAKIQYWDIVDRVLGVDTLVLNDMQGGDVHVLQKRVLQAVKESHKEGSVGSILREALEKGDLSQLEARENAVMYVLAQAPTMGIFWTLYRAVHLNHTDKLRDSRREIVKAIKEDLRLHAPVATMFRRGALQDDELAGQKVHEGDGIIVSPMYIHTNPKQWENPLAYDADRWTSEIGDGKEIVDPKTDPKDERSRPTPLEEGQEPARYLPFGGGSQACQGRWFASDEMLIVIEEIVKAYDFEIINDNGLLKAPQKEQVRFHVYSRPDRDVWLRPIPLDKTDT